MTDARHLSPSIPPFPLEDSPAPLVTSAFVVLLALLTLSFYLVPDQAGRNVILYATALSTHLLMSRKQAWRLAYGHPGGWAVLLLVAFPCLSLIWSVGAEGDIVQDLLLAGYCIATVYLGVAWVLHWYPKAADALVVVLLLAGNLVGGASVAWWAMADRGPGGFRLQGLWGLDNPVHSSIALLAATVPVTFQVLRRQRSPWWLLGMIIPLSYVALAGARSAAAAYLLVLLAMVAVWRAGAVLWVLAGALIVGILAIALLGVGVVEEVWFARGVSFRNVVWQQVLAAYESCNALIGCGVASPPTVDLGGRVGKRAHSIVLATLYYQGLLGFICFIGALAWLLWRALRASRTQESRSWTYLLGYVLLANVTSGDHILVRAELFWLYFWLPVMIIAAMSREMPPPTPT